MPSADTSKSEGRRIAFLTYAHAEPFHIALMDMAQSALADEGFGPGGGHEYRRWFGNRDRDLTAEHADRIADWQPGVILSFMTNADLALLERTGGTGAPVVCWSMDPVGAGLIRNADAPEGNLTGVTLAEPLQRSQLALAMALRPGLRQVAMLHNPTYAVAPPALDCLAREAKRHAIGVTAYQCLAVEGIAGAFAQMARDGLDTCVVGPHELFNGNGARIAEAAAAAGVLGIGLQSVPENGGAAGFIPDFAAVWRRGGSLAARILCGAKVRDTPFDRSVNLRLTVNVAGLARLGLTMPPEVRMMADTVLGEP